VLFRDRTAVALTAVIFGTFSDPTNPGMEP
jgi:hypothetical protein